MLLFFQNCYMHNDNKSRIMIVPHRKINLDDYDSFCPWPKYISQSVKTEMSLEKTSIQTQEVCRKVKKIWEMVCTLLKQEYLQSSIV